MQWPKKYAVIAFSGDTLRTFKFGDLTECYDFCTKYSWEKRVAGNKKVKLILQEVCQGGI